MEVETKIREKIELFTSSIARAGTFVWKDMSSITCQIQFKANKKPGKFKHWQYCQLRENRDVDVLQVLEQSWNEKGHPASDRFS